MPPFNLAQSATIRLFVNPLTLRHIPSTARRVMAPHFRKALLVSSALLPFFEERVDHHRDIKANQKSPHDAVPLRSLEATLSRNRRGYLAIAFQSHFPFAFKPNTTSRRMASERPG